MWVALNRSCSIDMKQIVPLRTLGIASLTALLASYSGLAVAQDVAVDPTTSGVTGEVFPDASVATPEINVSPAVPSSVPGDAGENVTDSKSSLSRNDSGAIIKDATRRGLLMPFDRLVKKLKVTLPGELVRVQLFSRSAQLWVYEIAVLDDAGRYTFAVVNAKTGAVIRKRTK
jgi:hypothetical protein